MKNFLIFFLILTSCFLLLNPAFARADEMSSSSAEVARVDYQLAYPGLLPDHPLYFLKAARDKVYAFFISSPVKKAEFDLLQADKRVESSYLLIQKGKVDLAE